MEIPEYMKWLAVMVAAGITTAVAIQILSGYVLKIATNAAKSELQTLITAAQAKVYQPPPQTSMPISKDSTTSWV